MKDFRQYVVQHRHDQSDIMDLLRRGQLAKALRIARSIGFEIPQQDIDIVAKAMFHSGRAGELLALIGKVDVKLPFDINSLLIRAFKAKDYHSFLKQIHRLGMASYHKVRIRSAIVGIEKTAPLEANAWCKKLGLINPSTEVTDLHEFE